MPYPIPDGPHNDDWKSLLTPCFAVIDEVFREHKIPFPIQIGGGSMLLRRYRHRRSRDLDLFVSDTRLVRWSSPRFNEAAADLFPDYGEDSVTTKLIVGLQEVDIIACAPVILEGATEEEELLGRTVFIERPREILAKKIVYRGRLFQPRDIFDFACIAKAEPEEVAAILPWLSPAHLADLTRRLDEVEPFLAKELADKVDPYPEFAGTIASCLTMVRGIVRDWSEALRPAIDVPAHPVGYRVQYSRNGRKIVIRNVDEDGRAGAISNPLGPAILSADEGPQWFIDGVELSEEDWQRQT